MSIVANLDKKARASHFAVETARIHRATCEKVAPEAEALTAMQAQRLSKPAASCCRPNQSAEWKATLKTRQDTIAHVEIANPKNPADVPLFGGLADVAAAYLKPGKYAAFVTVPEGGDHGPETGEGTLTIAKDGTYTLTMKAATATPGTYTVVQKDAPAPAPEKAPAKKAAAPRKPRTTKKAASTGGAAMTEATAKAILDLPVEERIAAGLAAGRKNAEAEKAAKDAPKKVTAKTPAAPAAAGETVDMGGKRVRAGSTTVAYVSKTLSESGKSIVRCEWLTDGGVTIVQERGRWTVGGTDAPEVKTLAAAVALAPR